MQIRDKGLNSIEATAARLGVRPVTIRMWAAARKITKVKLGRRVLIPEAEIQRLIEENTVPRLQRGAR